MVTTADVIQMLSQQTSEIPLSGVVEGGLYWDCLTKRRLRDPKSLELYGFHVYSQNDEDGIIQEIFERIGTTNQKFIEFGVQDGLESNGHYLLLKGWSGLWIEGDLDCVKKLLRAFRPAVRTGHLTVCNAFIDRDNINPLIKQAGFHGEIDLLSIDVDGNDYYIWEAIDVVNPRVVAIEYNGKIPPDLNWKMAYDKWHLWDGSDRHGASLKALELLGQSKGYRLVGTNLNGVNAFFVREDLAGDQFITPYHAEYLYNPLRLNLKFQISHPAKYFLGYQKNDCGLLDYQDMEFVVGFHGIEYNEGREFAWTSSGISKFRVVKTKNGDVCYIPYQIPEQIEKNYLEMCNLQAQICGGRTDRCHIEADKGCIQIAGLSQAPVGTSIEVVISEQLLWRPSELIGTTDKRALGICIYNDVEFK